jgi:hypothetical protein
LLVMVVKLDGNSTERNIWKRHKIEKSWMM